MHPPDPWIPTYDVLKEIWHAPTTLAYALAWLGVCLALAGFIVRLRGRPPWQRCFKLVLFVSLASYIIGVWAVGIGIIYYPSWKYPSDYWNTIDLRAWRHALFVTLGLHALYGMTLLFWGGALLVDIVREKRKATGLLQVDKDHHGRAETWKRGTTTVTPAETPAKQPVEE